MKGITEVGYHRENVTVKHNLYISVHLPTHAHLLCLQSVLQLSRLGTLIGQLGFGHRQLLLQRLNTGRQDSCCGTAQQLHLSTLASTV